MNVRRAVGSGRELPEWSGHRLELLSSGVRLRKGDWSELWSDVTMGRLAGPIIESLAGALPRFRLSPARIFEPSRARKARLTKVAKLALGCFVDRPCNFNNLAVVFVLLFPHRRNLHPAIQRP